MTDTEPNESEFEVLAEDLEEFTSLCAEEDLDVQIEREFDGRIVRDIVGNAETVVTFAPVVYGSAKIAIARVKGSRTGITKVDKLLDRKAGAHVIYTNDKGQLADARVRNDESPYGLVRVVWPHEELDINAKGTIVDVASRLEFVKRVKATLHDAGLELNELRDEVATWDGVEKAQLFVRGGASRKATND